MRCKADGAQEMRHIIQIGEFSSTTQRSRSLAQTIIQRFLSSSTTLTRYPALLNHNTGWECRYPGVDVYEDRELELTSYTSINVEQQIKRVVAAIGKRNIAA